MSYTDLLRFVFSLSVALVCAGESFAAPSRLVPARGEMMIFRRAFSADHLKSHPLQLVKNSTLTLNNSKGILAATWSASFRDIRTDEIIQAKSSGSCRSRGVSKIECTFGTPTSVANFIVERRGIRAIIPEGHGVRFVGEKDGLVWSEILIGTDEDNRQFHLDAKN